MPIIHEEYLYWLPFIVADFPFSNPKHVQYAVAHLQSWRTCPECQKEAQTRQFPIAEVRILAFRQEQLSPPERRRRETTMDYLGGYLEEKHSRHTADAGEAPHRAMQAAARHLEAEGVPPEDAAKIAADLAFPGDDDE